MKIGNVHEREIAAPQELIAAHLADLSHVWPTQIGPASRPQGHRRYDVGLMT
jgi:hypothetical protein